MRYKDIALKMRYINFGHLIHCTLYRGVPFMFRRLWLRLVSSVVWRLPGRPARLLASFAQAERGSSYDMLEAAERTEDPKLRIKYLRHSLDEARHARLFRNRAMALNPDRASAALMDANYLSSHGIIRSESLFERFGETRFLAFVYDAESRGLEQFQMYCDLKLPDPDTIDTLKRIIKDERFHRSYSGAELQRRSQKGQKSDVQQAMRAQYWSNPWEAWLRFGRVLGSVMGRFWLWLLYVLLVGFFRPFAKLESQGWHYNPSKRVSIDDARQQS